MKKFFDILLEPLKAFASRDFAEKLSVFLNRRKFLLYVIAAVITLLAVYVHYIHPNI